MHGGREDDPQRDTGQAVHMAGAICVVLERGWEACSRAFLVRP